MSSKIGLKLTLKYSLNFTIPKRSKKLIKFIIIHYTGMKKENDAINKLCSPKSKVSSHYYIKSNGDIINLVPDFYEAWHAGKSNWKSFRSLNRHSLGIEITNPGHLHGYKNFSRKQIYSLKKLLSFLMKKYKINKKNILGHSDISPSRKKDPGEKFPWETLSKKGLSLWHKFKVKKLKKYRKIQLTNKKEENLFLNNLSKIGYVFKKNKKLEVKHVVQAFQRRFRQDLINGKVDKECLIISKSLI